MAHKHDCKRRLKTGANGCNQQPQAHREAATQQEVAERGRAGLDDIIGMAQIKDQSKVKSSCNDVYEARKDNFGAKAIC